MKKYSFYLAAMMIAVMTLGLTACGSDDDEPDGGDIVGTWSGTTSEEWLGLFDFMYAGGEQLIQFRKDGTFVEVDVYYWTEEYLEEGQTNPEIEIIRGNYTLSGEKLIMTGIDEDGENYRAVFNCKIKGNTMTITTTEGLIIALNFDRVKDSAIEKYL